MNLLVASVVMNKPPSWTGVEGRRPLVQKSSVCPNPPLKPKFARQASIR